MTSCLSALKLEVYNAVSSPRIVTMANQVLTINVTENVSSHISSVLFSSLRSFLLMNTVVLLGSFRNRCLTCDHKQNESSSRHVDSTKLGHSFTFWSMSTKQWLEEFFTFQGQILVNGAAVLEAAVEAKNGRLYVLDRVLIPASIEPVLPHRCDSTETSIIKVRLEVDVICNWLWIKYYFSFVK